MLFCRNLLIYLGDSARACVLASIDRLLAPDGLLVIGHADRLDSARHGGNSPRLVIQACFAYRRKAAVEASVSSFPVEPSRRTQGRGQVGMSPKTTEIPIPPNKGQIASRSGGSDRPSGEAAEP